MDPERTDTTSRCEADPEPEPTDRSNADLGSVPQNNSDPYGYGTGSATKGIQIRLSDKDNGNVHKDCGRYS